METESANMGRGLAVSKSLDFSSCRVANRTANVRYGSKADIQRHAHLRPLLGAKRTLDVRFSSLKRRPAAGDFDRRREGHLNLD